MCAKPHCTARNDAGRFAGAGATSPLTIMIPQVQEGGACGKPNVGYQHVVVFANTGAKLPAHENMRAVFA